MSSDTTGPGRADLARAAAEAARAITGVVRLEDGALGEFSTYADGERVGGIRIGTEDPSRVRLRLVVAYGRPIPEIAAEVEAAVRDRLGPRWRPARVDIEVVDVETRLPDHGADEGSVSSENRG